MESLSPGHVIFVLNRRNSVKPTRIGRKIRFQMGRRRFCVICSRKADFQDFQGYAKPSRLFPAEEVKICTEISEENIFPSISLGESRSLYKVKLKTSNLYGSSLSNLNAGILLCLIDENGDSMLQRVSASLMTNDSIESTDKIDPNILCFQRGSANDITFEGPRLGKIEAIWIGLESGQWRLGGISLTVLNSCKPSLEQSDGAKVQYLGFQYNVEVDDILLGEGSDTSMVELRPCLVTELANVDPSTLLSQTLSQSTSISSGAISNEESMKEYADLKLSLLLYDAILIFVGASVSSFSVGESTAFVFLFGGFSGFLYLLLLQRSVDGLPAPAIISQETNGIERLFGGFKGPTSVLALAIGLTVVVLKYYSSGGVPFELTPKEILVGMMGFLCCKVAVVLAAFKPVTLHAKENK